MISSYVRAIFMAVACVITSICATPSAMAASRDGDWRVLVQTPDHCGTSQWRVVIIGGRVYHPDLVFVGGWPAALNGQVSPSGRIAINAVAGPRFATGTGRLGPRQGSGRWAGRGPSGTCAGTWTATRLNERINAAFARQ
jgi:hypothetical protein